MFLVASLYSYIYLTDFRLQSPFSSVIFIMSL